MSEQEIITRLFLAAAVGGMIGAEREYRDKSAGFRTMILIGVGSALFTILAFMIGETHPDSDPTRIISYIISGIGFLGAGVIIKDEKTIKGLTTAATIWLTAALGMGIGSGFFFPTIIAFAIIMTSLVVLPPVEHWIDSRRVSRSYEIELISAESYDRVLQLFADCNLTLFKDRKRMRSGAYWLYLSANGSTDEHNQLGEKLLASKHVSSF